MKSKKLIVLVTILLLLGTLALYKRSARPDKEVFTAQTGQTAAGPSFGASFVTRLEIHRGPDRMVFVKDPSGGWAFEDGAPARKHLIEGLLTKLGGLRGEVRAEGPGLFEDFSITDDKAFHLEVSAAAEKLAHFLVSPLRPRGTQNFVRAAGSDRVLVTDTDILAELAVFSDGDKLQRRLFEEPPAPAPAKAS